MTYTIDEVSIRFYKRTSAGGTVYGLADSVREVVESGYICVVGSETAVEKEKALFNHIEPLV